MTRTKAYFVEKISERTGLPRNQVKILIEEFLEEIKETLRNNDRVEIRGFGVFVNKLRRGKIGRNPRNKVEVRIPDRYQPTFKPSREFRKEIERKIKVQ